MQGRDTMKTNTVYFGIDVSKRALHFANTKKFLKKFDNTKIGITKLIAHLKKLADLENLLVTVEATGGYERLAVEMMQDEQISVHVAQPGCVKNYAKSLKVLAKTDQLDAQVIARFAEGTQVQPTAKIPEKIRQMRALVDRREQVVADRVREENRLETCPDADVVKELRRSISRLKGQERKLDKKMKRLEKSDKELCAKAEILRDQKGVGSKTTFVLLSHLPELGHASRGQIAALAGLAPHANESGGWFGKRTIFGGRALVRKAMYMAARTAAQWCPVLSKFYKRLREKGKPFKVAIIAVARKLLVRLNTQLKEIEKTTKERTAEITIKTIIAT